MRAARRVSPRVRWTLIGVAGLLLVWLAIVTIFMVLARQRVDEGIRELEDARAKLSPGALVRGEGRDALRKAERDFARAHDLVANAIVGPLRFTPVVGRQVRSIDAMTDGATQVVDSGRRAMDDARRTLKGRRPKGPGRVRLVVKLQGIAATAERRIRAVDLGPGSHLIGPIDSARQKFAHRLHDVQKALTDARFVAEGSARFLQGPRRYLVLAANNGEMRAGSGMLLQAGTLTLADGGFHLGEMQPTADLHLPPGAVPVTGDLADRWGWLHPSEEWRNLAATPRFDVTAPLAAQMWQARTGETVDGVLALDPVALRAFVAAEGPVEADGRTFKASDVVDYILLRQYEDFPFYDPAQQARRDQLSAIARATVDALDNRDWKAADLVDELRTAAQGRHLLAWARDPVEQRGWRAAGISGELHRHSVLASVLNMGGNKLDQFLTIDARLGTQRTRTGRKVAIEVRLRNETPAGQPRYVAGPFPGIDVGEGVYLGVLSVNLPGASRHVSIEGATKLVAAGADGPTRVVAAPVRVDPGGSLVLTVRFQLPIGAGALDVEPTSRIPALRWTFGREQWSDGVARHVKL